MRQRIILCFTLAGMLSLWCAQALALDPALDVDQYAHTAWKIRDGFTKDTITAFAQTSDGYLWLGTDAGLARFDGVRNIPWESPDRTPLPGNRIRALLASRDGTLWIATWGGLASWDGRKLSIHPQFDGSTVNALLEDREGTVWVSATFPTTGLICALRGTRTECTGENGSLGASGPALYQTQDGALWASTDSDLWRWRPGSPKHYSLPEPAPGSYQQLGETETGTILALTRNGIQQVINDKVQSFPAPGSHRSIQPVFVLRDRDGALWIATSGGGLVHLHQGRTDVFDHSDGLSGDSITRLFEDREGNIWVSTTDGLDRFRALPAVTYSAKQGVPHGASAVFADNDGGVWFSTLGGGLYRWRDGQMFAYRAHIERRLPNGSPTPEEATAPDEVVVPGLPERAWASLFRDRRGRIWFGGGPQSSGFGYLENDRFTALKGIRAGYIDSIAEDSTGNLWIAHRDMGLLRVWPDLTVQPVKLSVGAKTGDAWRLAADPVRGGLWIGLFSGGVVHFADGRIDASYSAADGLGKGRVGDLHIAADGSVWAATDGGLSRIEGGRIATLTGKSGLPCDAVHASIEDDDGATWVYTACGLVRIARADLDAWSAAADRGKAPSTIPMFVLGDADGVRSVATLGTATPYLTKTRDGTLWFVTADGVATVDPRHLSINALPPPVHVEQIVADRKAYDSSPIHLPPLVRDLTIDYTALSLVAPEKMRFRYRLEGRDRDWEDAGNRRQAFYTDLAPGNYRFRVIASNNSGVWNEEGAALGFSIAPAYWQTNWFLALCATAFAALLWGAYRMRMRQIAWARNNEKRHREMEMELAHANRLAMMGQLTASIAHEVNQPLGAAITNAQAGLHWLKREPPDLTEVKTAFDEVVRAGNRAADVVASVRRMVKKAPGQGDNVRVNDEITEIAGITHGEATKHGVSVRTELAPDLPAITADRVELQQVLLNLVVNAIEAMSSVIDTGPGLDAAALERIFQPFYTSKEGGLGMGLAICRSIIESHGGKLWASANVPRGAVFQFTLPPKRPY